MNIAVLHLGLTEYRKCLNNEKRHEFIKTFEEKIYRLQTP